MPIILTREVGVQRVARWLMQARESTRRWQWSNRHDGLILVVVASHLFARAIDDSDGYGKATTMLFFLSYCGRPDRNFIDSGAFSGT